VPGTSFNYDEKGLEGRLSLLDFREVDINTSVHLPEITEKDCATKKDELIGIVDRAPIVLFYEDWQWVVGRSELLSWISLKKDGELSWDVDEGRIIAYAKENLSMRIDKGPESPKFSIENGKIKDFQPGKDGSEVDGAELVKDVRKFIVGGEEFISIKTKEVPQVSGIADANVDFSGVEEVIGESSLAFTGSSGSRIKNIKNGASKISGLLVKPGEEFSTVKTLSPIETSNGYVKEAVINGGTITHEVGGGLCHLSTTLFRTVLDAGLPITMRQNHSYDMSYYTPAGTDAAIYDPSPDFRFINDTPHNILIMAWIDSTKLNIQIWGSDDGRVVERTKPVKYNIVYPKAAKMIKTADLATGVTQCNYAAYTGSDTYFDYKVTYPDGRIKEERMKSHYVPRQGVCYVGI
jgi:vancomycin resistance protein YoaR